MAITTITINATWQAITAAGESGSAWMVENPDDNGKKVQADVYIYHTDGTAPTGDQKLTESKRLFTPKGNTDIMLLSADNASDIFYARCKTAGSEAKINVDVV